MYISKKFEDLTISDDFMYQLDKGMDYMQLKQSFVIFVCTFDPFQLGRHIYTFTNRCYLPANRMMLELIRKYGKNFKVSFSISGMVIEQFREYAPEVIDSFKELVATGCVEILAETYSHSLASLVDEGDGNVRWLNRYAQPLSTDEWQNGPKQLQILLSDRFLIAINATLEVTEIVLPAGEWHAIPPFAGEDNPVITAVWQGPAHGLCVFQR